MKKPPMSRKKEGETNAVIIDRRGNQIPGHLAIGPQQPSYVSAALQVPCPLPYPPMTPYSTPLPFLPQSPPFIPP